MFSYVLRHWVRPADPTIKNTACLFPLTLAAHMGRENMFSLIMELNCVVSQHLLLYVIMLYYVNVAQWFSTFFT